MTMTTIKIAAAAAVEAPRRPAQRCGWVGVFCSLYSMC